ncbi:MAG: helix-turn-helix domain-containing protein [Spirochaetaceae bacterium]|jgi:transcriptional regulator with XRE-family HTH domain|nr:helix-turn-helix domain-containing protein [Spirochaetaceae bacterium]
MNYTIEELRALFGDNLKKLRMDAKISQLKLGLKIDLTHNFINDIERGKKGASFETVVKLAEALGVEPYRFFVPKWEPREEDFLGYPNHVESLLKAVDDFKGYYGRGNSE